MPGLSGERGLEVLRHLRQTERWDSRDLAEDELEQLSELGAQTGNPLFRDADVEAVAILMHEAGGFWHICGGGRDACLAETELVWQAFDVSFEQLFALTY